MRFWPAVVIAALAQAPSAVNLASLARPLQPAEVKTVLDAAHRALADRTLTLSIPGMSGGMQVRMGANGRPKVVQFGAGAGGAYWGNGTEGGRSTWTRTDLVEFTGKRARRCDGRHVAGELVLTYHRVQRSDHPVDSWTATAGTQPTDLTGDPMRLPWDHVFEMLARTGPGIASDLHANVDGQSARAFTAPYTPPPPLTRNSDTLPEELTQTLWIDSETLLPVRWQATERLRSTWTIDFQYEPLDLRPPDGVQPPACIP